MEVRWGSKERAGSGHYCSQCRLQIDIYRASEDTGLNHKFTGAGQRLQRLFLGPSIQVLIRHGRTLARRNPTVPGCLSEFATQHNMVRERL